jgi:hypothetical protein
VKKPTSTKIPPVLKAMLLLNAPAHFRLLLATSLNPTLSLRTISTSQLPRIAQPSFWALLIPRFFRWSHNGISKSERLRRFLENPSTPVLSLALLVGSQAIHTIKLKNEMTETERKAEAKISLLKRVIERIQSGEDVNVEKELGTGNPVAEEEWMNGESMRLFGNTIG